MGRIELKHVGLTFRVTRFGPVRFRDQLMQKLFLRTSTPVIEVPALQDINLALSDGDRVGIVGLNGAGKSTLLQVLAGIYPPQQGTRRVDGLISSLFDVNLGFEADATGWENIAYRGYLQGQSKRSVREKMKSVAEFSELGRYLDMPVRYYSTGMRLRLGFAISTAIDPDILLIDEAFQAGDLSFREKAKQRIRGVVSNARIVVAVSHDLDVLQELCEKAIWMHHGRIRQTGPAKEVIASYQVEAIKVWDAAVAAAKAA